MRCQNPHRRLPRSSRRLLHRLQFGPHLRCRRRRCYLLIRYSLLTRKMPYRHCLLPSLLHRCRRFV